MYPLWEKASFIAEVNVWSLSAWEEWKIVYDGNKKREAKSPRAIKYIKYFKVCSHPTKPRLYFVNNGDKK